MARSFRYTADRQIVNTILIPLLKLGLAPRVYSLLTTKGRRTGRPHSVPVTLIREGARSWLVAPYGAVDWVKNARASGEVRLSYGSMVSHCRTQELPPEDAAPILRTYLRMFPITRAYFSVPPDASIEAFIQEAQTRPVFALEPRSTQDAS